MYEKLDEVSFKELLGYSIKGEKVAHKNYLKLANKTKGLMSNKFEDLAKDEKRHAKELLKLHKMEFGDKDYVVPEVEGLPPHEGEFIEKIENVRNLIEAIDLSMKAEDNAYEIYKYLAKNNEKYRTLFKYIALMEKGHYESLKAEKYLYESGADRSERPGKRYTSSFEEMAEVSVEDTYKRI